MTLPVHDLALFVGAALLLNLTPGPDMLFVAGTGAARGRAAGLMAALGVGAGCLFHTLLAALGLTALLLMILRDDDVKAFPNMRFQLGRLIEPDTSVARFVQFIDRLPRSIWSRPEEGPP